MANELKFEKLPYPRKEPLFYVGDELHKAKQEKVQKLIKDAGLEGILFFRTEAVRYITDFFVKGYRPFIELEYVVVVPKDRQPVVGFSSGSDNYRLQLRSSIEDYRKLPVLEEWYKVIAQIFKDYGMTQGRVGIDILPYSIGEQLKKEFPKIEFVNANGLFMELTIFKLPKEIEYMRSTMEICEIGLMAAMAATKPGVRELDVAIEGEYAMRKAGSEYNAFIPLVVSGINSAIWERVATEKRIQYGDAVVIDLGCSYKGYTGDSARTIFAGGKVSPEQKKIYQATYRALQAAIAAVKPGAKCYEPDAAARKAIEDAGYGKYEHKFATGHQLGMGLHGYPWINRGVDFVIRPNMVMALEPRVTMFDRPDVGGVELESVVLVTETGCEVLNKVPYEEHLL